MKRLLRRLRGKGSENGHEDPRGEAARELEQAVAPAMSGEAGRWVTPPALGDTAPAAGSPDDDGADSGATYGGAPEGAGVPTTEESTAPAGAGGARARRTGPRRATGAAAPARSKSAAKKQPAARKAGAGKAAAAKATAGGAKKAAGRGTGAAQKAADRTVRKRQS